ncbi:hypothetical protein [Luteolibacter marinus]|uniref:hypothetical protein n=1 Tax=Luteolibacter marinus TaxID=2776705 RepID=UPI001869423C|nr:hypothetical protein [Luteolibacter marinus]
MLKARKTKVFTHKVSGFALIIALALMTLLMVIAVGLLTLSSISLRAASGSTAMATARQNAHMALILAIGDLQKQTGRDQRVTALADIAGKDDGTRLPAGAQPQNGTSVNRKTKGLTAIQTGTRHWTGVFNNRDDPSSIYTQTPSPAVVSWLVSSRDGATPPGSPSLLPSDATFAVDAGGKVGDPEKAVVLVGGASAGTGPGSIDRYVVAPVVPIAATGAPSPSGSYAWWIGDEGVKARIDIPRTLDDNTSDASLVAQRRGWETIDGLEDYPTPLSGPHDDLPKAITLGETELLIPGSGGTRSSPRQEIFHSATTASRTLLADALHGGLKVDLTSLLDGDLPTASPESEIETYPVKGARIIPRAAARTMRAPLWDAVKEFHDRTRDAGELVVQPSDSNLTAAIAPLIIDFRILMGARIRAGSSSSSSTFYVDPCGKIAIAIANPYARPLTWNDDLEIELLNQTPSGNHPSRIWPLGGSNGPAYIPRDPSEPAVFNNAVFRIKAGTLPPGEARAYTIAGTVVRDARTATRRTNVDLAPFESSRPYSFTNCVVMTNTNSYTAPLVMDVRESWQTTLAMVEMRLAGTSSRSVLRQIERFELDNGYFYPNQRTFSAPEAARITQPFPLMLYSFQISQPGTDYTPLMPSLYEAGQRSSTLRTFTDFNLQATRFRKPIASYNPPPFFVESNDSKSQLPASPPGGQTGGGFTRNLALSPVRWGHSTSGSETTVLFSLPSTLSSLAALQHADLTGDDTMASIGHQPGNAVGNSYATPFVKRRQTSQSRADYELIGSPNPSGARQTRTTYYDISYLLNAVLWDSFFFSTVPDGGTTPVNPALLPLDHGTPAAFRDPVAAASHLVVDGGFNVNSTDKTAWKAFLASARHFEHAADTDPDEGAAFPRSLAQTSPSATPPSGRDSDSFAGFRRVSDDELDAIAEELVKQVRLRGPFVSVAHFVNRALADLRAEPALTRAGALQVAIDESGANISLDGSRNGFSGIDPRTDAVTLREKNGAPRADFDGTDTDGRPPDSSGDPDWARTSRDNNYGAVASILADREMLKDARFKPEQGYRSTGIPGWLTQADVLQVIGPALTARSDTFRIRTMGEAFDADGNPAARAYCEAFVQRIPDYVDPSNAPTDRGSSLTPLNQIHGRQYKIVSFRWLSRGEI